MSIMTRDSTAVVVNVYRVDAQTDPMGQPVYLIESNNVLAISAREESGV